MPDNTAFHYEDENLLMLSALQHFLFCKRQCALIHLEGVWSDNRLTAEGKVLHQHVDSGGSETRKTIRIATSIRLVSHRLGISGIADMVEFHLSETEYDEHSQRIAVPLKGSKAFWRPFPVEYKHGKPKTHHADEVQLCAQAICLEEMLGVIIPAGVLFYGETRRRSDVVFSSELRRLTEDTAHGVHELLDKGVTPEPMFGKWCMSCSLIEECKPRQMSSRHSVKQWLNNQLDEICQENMTDLPFNT